ncbi:MAG: Carboxypeptidase precursor, partial [Frankiales bacterium]|nr:Carboxypeptidase precursor [Frankiales bacterium]
VLLASYVCLTPEQRKGVDLGLTDAAKAQLTKFGLRDDRLAHGVITGRAVGKGRKPVAGATLTLSKSIDTVLWKTNPLGQEVFPETLSSTMTAADDGTFTWHVNPSTRPAVAFKGEQEHWLLTVTGPTGEGVSRRLFVERGQTIDLGDVVVA